MSDASDPELDLDKPQPLVAHLTELRDRLLRSVLAVLLIFLGLFYFANDIYALVSQPLREFLPNGGNMIATEVASPFLTPFKLTLVASVFLAIPFLLHQVWGFVAPGYVPSRAEHSHSTVNQQRCIVLFRTSFRLLRSVSTRIRFFYQRRTRGRYRND